MFNLKFDPIGLLIQTANELYPDHNASVFWCNDLIDARGNGVTSLTVQQPSGTLILVSLDIPIHMAVEGLAHQIAHIVVEDDTAGPEHEHSMEWRGAFEALNLTYVKRVQAQAGESGAVQIINKDEENAKELGFESQQELYDLVSGVDLSDPGAMTAFEAWRRSDGTKNGLLKLREDLGIGGDGS